MQLGEEQLQDWRDPETYSPLLRADRSLFAWEWLRRNPDYRKAAASHVAPAIPVNDSPCWGLHRFEAPTVSVPFARPLWRSSLFPYVLEVEAVPACCGADCFDLRRLGSLATIARGMNGLEHLLLSDGLRGIRLDVVAGTVMEGPVRLHYRLAGIGSAAGPLLSLRRLLALCEHGAFAASLHPAEIRARRLILMLRAHDGMASGASQREIAAALLASEAAEPRWRILAPSLRSRVQRLVKGASAMCGGNYRSLLQHRDHRSPN